MEEELTEEILKELKEEDLLMITYPGRMGDVAGCSFAINHDGIHIYRIEDLYHFKGDIFKQFPKWQEDLKNQVEKKKTKDYKVIYMGMGNLLGVKEEIYKEFEKKVKEKLPEISESYGSEELRFGAACYTYWRSIIKDMYQ